MKNVAIEKIKYLQPNPVFVLHSNIVEVDAEETAAAAEFNRQKNAKQRNGIRAEDCKRECRKFKCLDCGKEWVENINAPLILSKSESQYYYPQAKNCSILK